jgi:hypothetical protein
MSTVDLSSARWRKSGRSTSGNNSACVEVAFVERATFIRDSKNRVGSVLVFSGNGLRELLGLGQVGETSDEE